MALHYALRGIENFGESCTTVGEDGERYISAKTDLLIWATIAVGIASITAENAEKFYTRFRLRERLLGPLWLKKDDPMTFDDIVRHVGLKTNASEISDQEFLTRMLHEFHNIINSQIKAWREEHGATHQG